ncbi:MAG: MGMT family protein [Planctomycetota bacterium]
MTHLTDDASVRLLVRKTRIGLVGLLMLEDVLQQTKFGRHSIVDLVNEFGIQKAPSHRKTEFEKTMLDEVEAYARGEEVDFQHWKIEMEHLSDFQKSVTDACRAIPYGEMRSYGELATIAGSPGAARAVGTVMRRNRFPLIVPCHRVIGAGGSLGGYSAVDGTATKVRLLELEGVTQFNG